LCSDPFIFFIRMKLWENKLWYCATQHVIPDRNCLQFPGLGAAFLLNCFISLVMSLHQNEPYLLVPGNCPLL
jgi:hypothetical protein